MLSIFKKISQIGLISSRLYNNQTFYQVFERDLQQCQQEAIIESPFLTTYRLKTLLPSLRKLTRRGVRVIINTKPPQEQEGYLRQEAQLCIDILQASDIKVLYTGGHHRKLAIIDRQTLWEGSLNILSQNDSCEIMRRIESPELATEMLRFTRLDSFLDH